MKPRTEAQKLASRTNGALSKGPVTPEGKAKASLNAVTHGLHAVNPVLHVENPEEWKIFLNDHIQHWAPDSLPEWDLVVNELAGTKWRLKRLRKTEIALMDLETERVQDAIRKACARPDADLLIAGAWESLQTTSNLALDRLHRHETRLCRIIAKAESRLEAIMAARQKQEIDNEFTAVSEGPVPSVDPEVDATVNEPGQTRQQLRPVLVGQPENVGLAGKPEPSSDPRRSIKDKEAA